MITRLSEPHTYALALAVVVGFVIIAVKLISYMDIRNERFSDRFMAFKGIDPYESDKDNEPATLSTDALPPVGIVDHHAAQVKDFTLPHRPVSPFPTRPIRDNPQA